VLDLSLTGVLFYCNFFDLCFSFDQESVKQAVSNPEFAFTPGRIKSQSNNLVFSEDGS